MLKTLSHATQSIFNFKNGEKTIHPNNHAYILACEFGTLQTRCFKFILFLSIGLVVNRSVSSVVETLLSIREVWGSNPGLLNAATFFEGEPVIRNTLRCNYASIMKILMLVELFMRSRCYCFANTEVASSIFFIILKKLKMFFPS